MSPRRGKPGRFDGARPSIPIHHTIAGPEAAWKRNDGDEGAVAEGRPHAHAGRSYPCEARDCDRLPDDLLHHGSGELESVPVIPDLPPGDASHIERARLRGAIAAAAAVADPPRQSRDERRDIPSNGARPQTGGDCARRIEWMRSQPRMTPDREVRIHSIVSPDSKPRERGGITVRGRPDVRRELDCPPGSARGRLVRRCHRAISPVMIEPAPDREEVDAPHGVVATDDRRGGTEVGSLRDPVRDRMGTSPTTRLGARLLQTNMRR